MVSEQELVLIAGTGTFTKGRNIYQKGNVQLQTQLANEVTGLVSGSYEYRTTIYHDNGNYVFSCTCPAFEYQEVCKHCVALALAYNATELSTNHKNGNNEPFSSPDDKIKRYIEALQPEKLHDALYTFICEDKYHYNRWLTKAQLASEQQNFKSLKKLVSKALPLKDIWDYHRATEYFINAEQIVINVLESAEKLPPADELKLILHVYERLERVCERVDDSGGQRFGLQHQISIALCATIAKQEWEATQKAKWLAKALDYEYESFPDIPYDFQLTETEMDAFLAICQTEFDQFEVNSNVANRERNYSLQTRGKILLSNLPEAQHYESALKIKAKMATELHDALNLSQFCLENEDELKAEDWLLLAQKLVSMPHHRNYWNDQAVKVYTALGETKRAWRIAWQMFAERPNYSAWQALQKHATTIGYKPGKLKEDVETQLLEVSKQGNSNQLWAANTDIVYFYLSDNQMNKAVNWLDSNKASEHVLKDAAILLAPNFPDKSINYCTRALSSILRHAENKNYQDAVDLLQKIDTSLPDNQEVNQSFEKLINDIANENSRRPNMMKLLRSYFGQYL